MYVAIDLEIFALIFNQIWKFCFKRTLIRMKFHSTTSDNYFMERVIHGNILEKTKRRLRVKNNKTKIILVCGTVTLLEVESHPLYRWYKRLIIQVLLSHPTISGSEVEDLFTCKINLMSPPQQGKNISNFKG